MGIGHKQKTFFKTNWKHRMCGGGELRQERAGRGRRPLSTKEPIHLIFKTHQFKLRHGTLRASRSFVLVNEIVKRYAARFYIKIDHWSIQGDHIHMMVRAPRRAMFHHFHRVVAGQIAQQFEREGLLRGRGVSGVTDTPTLSKTGSGLWKFRPYSRVVRGFRACRIVRDYIKLNELEALGKIPYRRQRLRGLSSEEWELLQA